jgi:hypothetical protein
VDGRDKPGHDDVDESAQGAVGMTRCALPWIAAPRRSAQ